MADEIQKELEHYKRILSLGEHDVAISGYIAYVNIVKQQVEHIKDFQIKSNIDGKKTETVLYDRTVSMWEKLPDMISRMNSLRAELKIDYDPDAGKPKIGAVTPQTIARLNGKQE